MLIGIYCDQYKRFFFSRRNDSVLCEKTCNVKRKFLRTLKIIRFIIISKWLRLTLMWVCLENKRDRLYMFIQKYFYYLIYTFATWCNITYYRLVIFCTSIQRRKRIKNIYPACWDKYSPTYSLYNIFYNVDILNGYN